ncbi:TPA: hypothetical protein JRX02_002323 [Elizabethkingia anophelis]|uniref:hypothetical protein n=1 Tax=Elizabethkingia anophelis TaxID=1117645 RepID=UPI00296C0A2B|nr:hypothetical protein [Elizabethkingia anophelis]HAY3503877.1 hypothetical protein [Elizabethkingia anophelis]HAY3511855.1 hypothetical protein [Elizabethkingia anophelis]HAY3515940.1 hypothetical protein [Elizabethkingia anophelis]HAY3519806.1 hypothetical protein [Elizabethkingia anophelis]
MKLLYSDKIELIDGCPSISFSGNLKLFRFVNSDNLEKSFLPKAFTKASMKQTCNAWGLSVYKNQNAAIEIYNSLPGGMREKFNKIMMCEIQDVDGVKYQSGKECNHYTFFPVANFDFNKRFKFIDHER